MLRRIAVALVAAGALAAPAVAQDLAATWKALDYGDEATARAEFARRAAEASLWQAVASRGEARKAAAERALAAAPDAGGWLAAAARGLIAEAAGDGVYVFKSAVKSTIPPGRKLCRCAHRTHQA